MNVPFKEGKDVTRDEVNNLYIEATRNKGLKIKDIAKAVDRSESLLSRWFRHQISISPTVELRILEFVKNYEPKYKTIKIIDN